MEAKALLVQEFVPMSADVGQLVYRRDADGAVVPYVEETKSDMLCPGAERLVADDVKSDFVVDMNGHLFELRSETQLLRSVGAEHGFLRG